MVRLMAKRADKANKKVDDKKVRSLKLEIKSAVKDLENANADAFTIEGATTSNSVKKDIERRQKKAQKTIDDCNKKLSKMGVPTVDVVIRTPEEILKARQENSNADKNNTKAEEKKEESAKKETKKEEAPKTEEQPKEETTTEEKKDSRITFGQVVDSAKESAQNLKDDIAEIFEKAHYVRVGLDNLTKEESDDNKVCYSIYFNTMDGLRDPNVVCEYLKHFNAGEYSPEPLFQKGERLYGLLSDFYASPMFSQKGIDSRVNLIGKFNELNREISPAYDNDNDNKKIKEKLYTKAARESYNTGKNVKFTAYNQNALKEIAWLCAHSYMFNIFLDEYKIFNLIPSGDEEVKPIWNQYISQMNDLPSDVKAYFMFMEDGTMPFKELTKSRYRIDPVSGLALKPGNEPALSESPQDDIPFDADKVVGRPIDLNKEATEAAYAAKNEELDRELREAIDRDRCFEEAAASFDHATTSSRVMFGDVEPEAKVEFTFGSLNKKKEDSSTKNVVNPADVASSMNQNTQSKARVVTDPKTGLPTVVDANEYTENNQYWEKQIPRLDKFTRTINKIGFGVIYDTAVGFPGLLTAKIVDLKTKMLYKTVMIDPCLIYGDTLRVITMENPQGDIRRETFIPISQENIIVKYIKNGLNKDDRKKLSEALPRAITDFRENYTLLDKVDLRNCNIDGKPMCFNDWRQMVINISNVLRVDGYPVCRVRVTDIKSPKKFTLVCDENVLAAFNTNIFNEESHRQNAMSGLKVEYDEEAYKDNGNINVSYNDDKVA